MDAQMVFTKGQEALMILLMVSMPILLTVLVVGLLVSVIQAITQINEASLSFVPKLLVAVGVMIFAGPWMLSTMVDYIRRTLESIPSLIV
ncbi:flagellar biosynthesis protein FliQ [Limnohabitans sp. DM1]|uniref:flagellar biosynthesis protein FliQ n=1 Tax=Limnohabitans sp. DM1 TaxID=1597955 RepID=UPI000B7FEC68|nr:flagellar biosynthesis protein FliQ [Limnohabitans sp. DM1]